MVRKTLIQCHVTTLECFAKKIRIEVFGQKKVRLHQQYNSIGHLKWVLETSMKKVSHDHENTKRDVKSILSVLNPDQVASLFSKTNNEIGTKCEDCERIERRNGNKLRN